MINKILSNLLLTFIVFNLHQLTDSKVQLNKTNVNNHKSNDKARSYQGDKMVTRGGGGGLWEIGFC